MADPKYPKSPQVDIFRTETKGVRWLEAAATIDGAKCRVRELAARSPAVYLILCHKTGNILVIKQDAADVAPGSNDLRFLSLRRA